MEQEQIMLEAVPGLTTVKQDAFIDSSKVSSMSVKIFGAGSIGSVMAVHLAKTGFTDITLYDFDTVDEDNIGSQEFKLSHIGMKKTDAIQKLLKEDYNFDVSVVDGKIDEETQILPEPNTIYFCAFDSLEARNMLWSKLKNFPIIFGESRTGQENHRFYFVDLRNPDSEWIAQYEKSLDITGPRVELKCGEKGCYSNNAEIVAKIVKQMVNIAEGKPHARLCIGSWGCPSSVFVMPVEEVPSEIIYD